MPVAAAATATATHTLTPSWRSGSGGDSSGTAESVPVRDAVPEDVAEGVTVSLNGHVGHAGAAACRALP